MLDRIVAAVAESRSGMDLRELSRRCEIDPSALEGMIQLLVRKGRLKDSSVVGCEGAEGATCTCSTACAGARGPCPFLAAPPRVISLATCDDRDD